MNIVFGKLDESVRKDQKITVEKLQTVMAAADYKENGAKVSVL